MQACVFFISPRFSFYNTSSRLLSHTVVLYHAVLAVQCRLSCFTFPLQSQIIMPIHIPSKISYPQNSSIFFLNHHYRGFTLNCCPILDNFCKLLKEYVLWRQISIYIVNICKKQRNVYLAFIFGWDIYAIEWISGTHHTVSILALQLIRGEGRYLEPHYNLSVSHSGSHGRHLATGKTTE